MARYTVTADNAKDEDGKELGHRETKYSTFMTRHPEYDSKYWDRLSALYQGGKALLQNRPLLEEIFPKHRREHPDIYGERIACAHYMPYAAEIIGNTITGACSDPLVFSMDGKDREIPEFYSDFIDDTSRPSKRTKCTLLEFVYDRLLSALIRGHSWMQVDLPRVEGEFDDKLKEEKAGARGAYLVALDADRVIDWEVDEDDELLWAITMKTTNRRSTPDGGRNTITEEFTVLDASGYQVWECTYKKDKPPTEETKVIMIDQGEHSFGMVPLIPFSLPPSLWAMEKMESACRALLRDVNSMLWNFRQNSHPQLYEFLATEVGSQIKTVGANQEDPSRALSQQRGEGYVQARGGDDKAAYVEPGMQSSEFGLKLVAWHRDEMHRVNNQMGHSTDVAGASIRRSADSKSMDVDAEEMLYRELGRHMKLLVASIFNAVRSGRKDEEEVLEGFKSKGMDKFNKRSTEGHIENAVLVQSMAIESPTLDRALKLDVAHAHFGDELTDEQYGDIEEELDDNINAESFEGGLLTPEEIAAAAANRERPNRPAEPDDDDGTLVGDDD